MKDTEKARVMCALAAVELNMSECMEVEGWWLMLGPDARRAWKEQQALVRSYQHEVQNQK